MDWVDSFALAACSIMILCVVTFMLVVTKGLIFVPIAIIGIAAWAIHYFTNKE